MKQKESKEEKRKVCQGEANKERKNSKEVK